MNKRNSSGGHDECGSHLNASPQKQEATVEIVVEKESLADWGVVACVFFANFIAAFDTSGFGVFYPFLVEHFEATTAAVGWCSSINGFFQAFITLFASYPIQSLGCRFPAVFGCLLSSLGLSLSYFAPNLTTMYFTYGVIAGSGFGLAMLASNIIVHQRFSRNRNLASGIGWLGFSCGGIIGSILTNHLVQSYGRRGALLILGAIQAQRIPLCLFFRTPKRLITQSGKISGKSILRYLRETFDFSILRHARYSVYSVAYFFHLFCLYGYVPHTVNRAIQAGLTRDQAVIAATLIGGASTVSRVPVSFIANLPTVSSSLIFATGMFCAFLSIVAIFVNPGIVGTMASTILFGLHLGCAVTVFTNVTVDLMGVTLLPKSLAILQFIGGFARLASPSLIGWIYDVTKDYSKAFAVIGCMAFVSGTLMVALTVAIIRRRRQTITKDIELPASDRSPQNPLNSEGKT